MTRVFNGLLFGAEVVSFWIAWQNGVEFCGDS